MVSVQIMTGHWFRWRLVEQQGETILEKKNYFYNWFKDIQKSIYGYPKIRLI